MRRRVIFAYMLFVGEWRKRGESLHNSKLISSDSAYEPYDGKNGSDSNLQTNSSHLVHTQHNSVLDALVHDLYPVWMQERSFYLVFSSNF